MKTSCYIMLASISFRILASASCFSAGLIYIRKVLVLSFENYNETTKTANETRIYCRAWFGQSWGQLQQSAATATTFASTGEDFTKGS